MLLQRLDALQMGLLLGQRGLPIALEHEADVAQDQPLDRADERRAPIMRYARVAARPGGQMLAVEPVAAHDPWGLDAPLEMHLAHPDELGGVGFAELGVEETLEVVELLADEVVDRAADGLVALEQRRRRRMSIEIGVEGPGELLAAFGEHPAEAPNRRRLPFGEIQKMVENLRKHANDVLPIRGGPHFTIFFRVMAKILMLPPS